MEFLQSGFTMVQIIWGHVDSSAGLKSSYCRYVRTQRTEAVSLFNSQMVNVR